MTIPTVYARREPPASSEVRDAAKFDPSALNRWRDVQVYHDREATRPFGRFPCHYSNKPRRGQRHVTLNCFRYRLEWLADPLPADHF
jgi:hypothetical protein